MLRVCGVTFDHTTNYGSCFQAYALQTAIEKIRVQGEGCSYQLVPMHKLKDYPKGDLLRSLLVKPFLMLHRTQFVPFEKRYMKFAPVSTLKELPFLNEETDVFVCGSDVIWNPDFNSGVDAYYLDFARKYKFSYAASFGKAEIPEETFGKIGEMLRSFDAISVRETTGREIAARCVDKPIRVVADPVLLLDRDEWDRLLPPLSGEDRYIFVYVTHLNDTITRFIDELKKVTGLKVVQAINGPKQGLRQGVLQVQKPEEWFRLLKGASFVITNSFHATVFSVLYHKRFFTVVRGNKSASINVRMNDFLNVVGLEDRMFSTVPERFDLGEINFQHADAVIGKMRQESIAFLQENLEAAYTRKQQAEG